MSRVGGLKQRKMKQITQFIRKIISIVRRADIKGFDYVAMVSSMSLRRIYDGQYTPTDFLVYLPGQSAKKERARGAAGRGRDRDGGIGRKARLVDFGPLSLLRFFPRPFPFVVAFSCGCRHYGRALSLSPSCRPFPPLSIAKREMGIPLI